MNKHKVDIVSEVSMPKRGDSLDNPLGHPKEFKLPTMEDVEEVIINHTVVKNYSQPIIIHSKTKKISAA